MKLEVSLQFAIQAQQVVNDSPYLKMRLEQTSSNTWEVTKSSLCECNIVNELPEELSYIMGEAGIYVSEYTISL